MALETSTDAIKGMFSIPGAPPCAARPRCSCMSPSSWSSRAVPCRALPSRGSEQGGAAYADSNAPYLPASARLRF